MPIGKCRDSLGSTDAVNLLDAQLMASGEQVLVVRAKGSRRRDDRQLGTPAAWAGTAVINTVDG